MQYGIDRYPAVVFDGEAVVYGVTDLTVALEPVSGMAVTGMAAMRASRRVALFLAMVAATASHRAHRYDYHTPDHYPDDDCCLVLHAVDAGRYLFLAALLT